jgi:hypothetical protein
MIYLFAYLGEKFLAINLFFLKVPSPEQGTSHTILSNSIILGKVIAFALVIMTFGYDY